MPNLRAVFRLVKHPLLSLLVLAATLMTAAVAGAQTTSRTVEGRVRRPVREGADSTGMGPTRDVWVTLHRVGKDTAGPVDSVRSDANGRYRFTYTPFGNADAVYFASTTYGGIAYFTAPLKTAKATGDETEITVFDTTSRTFPLSVKGRHLIVSKADSSDKRTVVEVFELSNDSLATLIAAEVPNAAPTWSVGIPAAAVDVRANEGEISPDAFAAQNGRVSVFAPIAPGVKQVAFSYKLPSSSFPLRVRSEAGAVVFEVLLEEAQGTVKGQGFTSVDAVALEGRNFRRFLSQDVKPDADAVIELPSSGTPGRNLYIAGLLVAVGFLMMLALTRSMQRAASKRGQVVPTLRPQEPDTPLGDRLAQEIAALDAVYARQDNPSAAVTAAYQARRAELKAALTQALAEAGSGR
ncbi:hypothetical protein [Gemmatimonas phototrophica]|uniref:Carboxypeptidase regulatory-like domain-containing protein n=1 Tax=Gemmatimonas phototrophica TaxID=1379270 RepID=A0A143BK36_9BACT|nr:hypothetical protein [Gemmatimonas phototrophica]AMW04794.1 hypothetical protein GEMMAAP_08020 [Gemmatimonas phototrophica]